MSFETTLAEEQFIQERLFIDPLAPDGFCAHPPPKIEYLASYSEISFKAGIKQRNHMRSKCRQIINFWSSFYYI